MAAITWNQLQAISDVMGNDRFQLLISPAGNTGGAQTLALRLQQVAVPEEQIEPMVVPIAGFEMSFPGRHVFDKSFTGSYVETVDGVVSNTIANWMQQVRGTASGNSAGYKAGVATQGTLYVYDTTGATALTYIIDNCWPSAVPQAQLDGTQTAPFQKQITFTYDRFNSLAAAPQ